ncbi:hypothetical protein [Tahibacter soli]|uniref:Phosphopantetheine adenylyltransferase n=1 Tax=Tahibacter soli TaxID=2983605 RepID=A0A9X3YSN4_9GAMM|nr:hypothetical protein [Tahibacter soli]MDC8015676.1 hypothetical protein [Tahibacter soli]
MNLAIAVLLTLVGAILALPVAGVVDAAALTRLYGIAFDDPDLVILMRHRAVLLGLIGAFVICAAFRPALRVPAFVAASVAIGAFLWIALSAGGYNAALRTVVIADVVALGLTAAAIVLHAISRGASR